MEEKLDSVEKKIGGRVLYSMCSEQHLKAIFANQTKAYMTNVKA